MRRKMKQIIACVLTVTMLMTCGADAGLTGILSAIGDLIIPRALAAGEGSVSGEGDFSIEDGKLISYSGEDSVVVIPDTVWAICDYAFSGNTVLREVTLPDTVTEIGSGAFENCTALVTVNLPDGLESIGGSAFYGCTSMEEITLPDGITEIGYSAFAENPARKYTSIDGDTAKSLARIDDCFHTAGNPDVALRWNYESNWNEETGVDDYTYPSLAAFARDNTITKAVVPEGVTEIDDSGFYECTDLSEVTLPSTLKNIERSAFQGCSGLTEVDIPDGVMEIGSSAFEDCASLVTVTLPQSLAKIGSSAFYGCTSMEEITLPDGIGEIESSAFAENPARKYTSIDGDTAKALARIDDCFHAAGNPDVVLRWNYESNWNEETETWTDTYPDLAAFAHDNTITKAVVPEGVTEIDDSGFYECTDLSEVTLPSTLKNIESSAFQGCSGLTEVDIPDGVTEIGSRAFEDCTALVTVTLPQSLAKIGSSAFYGCTSMEEITLPDGIEEIEYTAFENNSARRYASASSSTAKTLARISADFYTAGNPDVALRWYHERIWDEETETWTDTYPDLAAFARDNTITKAVVPEGVTVIDGSGFYECKDLSEVTLPGTLKKIKDSAFYGCSGLTKVDIPEGVTEIGSSAFEDCTALVTVTLPESLETIGSSAFYGCASMADITLPDGITEIGYSAFTGNPARRYTSIDGNAAKALARTGESFHAAGNPDVALRWNYESIYNEENETWTDTYPSLAAFARDTAITKAVVPEGVTVIDDSGFYECKDLSEVTLPGTLRKIGSSAFQSCSGLTEVDVPEGVTEIGSNAFEACAALVTVKLPQSLEKIGYSAFYGCTSMADITLPDGITQIESSAFAENPARRYTSIDGDTSKSLARIGESFHAAGNPDVALRWNYESTWNEETGMDEYTYPSLAAFARDNTITKAAVPEGVTVIDDYGFYECADLSDLTLPKTLKKIGSNAFEGCLSLTAAAVPQGVTEIGSNAFTECSALVTVTLPQSLEMIGSRAFYRCTSMADITLPDGITQIEPSAFDENPARKYTSIDGTTAKSLARIGESFHAAGNPDVALRWNYESIYNEETETWTDTYPFLAAFAHDTTITGAVVPEGVHEIAEDGFYECADLLEVTLPKTLRKIGSSAFRGCVGLTAADIPEGVAEIGESAFEDCSALVTLKLPESLETIGRSAFYDCASLADLTLPDGITEIGSAAFENVPARKYASMDSETARSLSRVDDGFLVSGNPDVVMNWLYEQVWNEDTDQYDYTYTILEARAYDTEVTKVQVPEGVNAIQSGGFQGCEHLEEITLPETLVRIGDNAFETCSALTGINMPSLLTYIGSGAFSGCSSMEDLTLPEGITEIGWGAFSGNPARKFTSALSETAKSLSRMGEVFHVPGNPDIALVWIAEWNYDEETDSYRYEYPDLAASACDKGIISGKVPDGVTLIQSDGFYECESLKEISLPDSLRRLDTCAFYGCVELTEIHLPDAVTEIGDSAFEGCTRLAEVTLPEGLEKIGSVAFFECQALENITLPENITEIGWSAFGECPAKLYCWDDSQTARAVSSSGHVFYIPGEEDFALQYRDISEAETLCLVAWEGEGDTVTLPYYVEYIAADAFYESAVRKVVVPENVLAIESWAFYNCQSLALVDLPYSITEISDYAFMYCNDSATFYVYADSYAEDYVREHGYVYAYKGASLKVAIENAPAGITVRATSENGAVQEKSPENGIAMYPSMIPDQKYTVEVVNSASSVLASTEIFIQNGVNEVNFTLNSTGTVHAVVRDAATRRNLTDETEILWYDGNDELYAAGAVVEAVPVGTELTVSVRLNDNLIRTYAEIRDTSFTVTEEEAYLSLPLTAYPTKTISGTVSEPENAVITVTQKSEVTGTEFTTGTVAESGRYSVTVPDLPATLTISAGGYAARTLDMNTGETDAGDTALEVVAGCRVHLEATLIRAAGAGETGREEPVSLEDADIQVTNRTSGAALTDFTLKDNTMILQNGVNAGDTLTVSVSGEAFAASSADAVIGPDLTASAVLKLTEKGGIAISLKERYDGQVRALVFDQSGILAFSEDQDSTAFFAGHLDAGDYTVVLMGVSTFLDIPEKLTDLPDVPCVSLDAEVENGVITSCSAEAVPAMDDSAWYAVKPDLIRFKTSRRVVTPGKNYSVSASVAQPVDGISQIAWVFEIPQGSVYVDNTLSVNGEFVTDAEISGSVITLPVSDPTRIVRLCLMPVQSGSQTIRGWLTYVLNGRQCRQKLSDLTVEAESLTVNVQSKTYTEKIYVFGIGPSQASVRIFDGNTLIGETETASSGRWEAWVDLNQPGTYSRHMISAVYTVRSGYVFRTTASLVTYQYMENPVSVSRVKMYTAAHEEDKANFESDQCVVFDFDSPDRTTASYSFNPSLPNCYFLVLFNGDTTSVSNVRIQVLCSDNSVKVLDAVYDETLKGWYAKEAFTGDAMPTGVTVSYYNGTELILEENNREVTINLTEMEDDFAGLEIFDITKTGEVSEKIATAMDFYNDALLRLKETVKARETEFSQQKILLELISGGLITRNSEVPDEAALLSGGYTRCRLTTGEKMYFRYENGDQIVVLPERNESYRMKSWENAGIALGDLNDAISWLMDCVTIIQHDYETYVYTLKRVITAVEDELGVSLEMYDKLDVEEIRESIMAYADFCNRVLNQFRVLLEKTAAAYLPFEKVGIELDVYDSLAREASDIGKRMLLCFKGDDCPYLSEGRKSMFNAMMLQTVLSGIVANQAFMELGALLTGEADSHSVIENPPSSAMVELGVDIASAISEYYVSQCDCFLTALFPPAPHPVVPQLDPSGYVFEAVESNRVTGAKATVWQSVTYKDEYDEDKTEERIWDAAAFGQVNPQTTDDLGQFGWDVPNGKWIVRVEKNGYRNAESAWMEVPPEWKDVHIELVSTEAPVIVNIRSEEDGYHILFSRYMPVEGVENFLHLKVNGEDAAITVSAVNGEKSPAGVMLATEFLMVPQSAVTAGNETILTVSGDMVSYAGIKLGEDRVYDLGDKLTAIETEESLEVGKKETAILKVTLLPAAEAMGRKITATVEGDAVTVTASAIVNEKGEAELTVSGVKPGEATVTLEVSKSVLTSEVLITCTGDLMDDIILTEEAAILKGSTWNLPVKLLPAEEAEGRVVYFTVTGEAVKASEQAQADGNGEAVCAVEALEEGTANIRVSVDGSEKTAEVKITVVDLEGKNVLKLPAFMTDIEEEAFAGCGAEVIVIPEKCTSIGSRAFAGCKNLRYLVIPDTAGLRMKKDACEGSNPVTVYYEIKEQ